MLNCLAKMHYYLPEEKTQVEFYGPLSDEDYYKIETSLNLVGEFRYYKRLREFVVLNFKEITAFLDNSPKKITEVKFSVDYIKSTDVEFVKIELNRLLMNYLSSIRTYLDHSETKLKKRYGKSSSEFDNFKKITNKLYDNKFAYRFVYKLRNYAQHIELPISKVGYETQRVLNSQEIRRTLTPYFDRDELLTKYSDWGVVKDDLLKEKRTFPLMPIIEQVTDSILQVAKVVEQDIRKSFSLPLKEVLGMIEDKSSEKGMVFLARDIKKNSKGEIILYTNVLLPINEMREILNESTES